MAPSVQTISRRLELYEVPDHQIDSGKIGLGPNNTRFQESEEAMTSYGDQLMGKDDNKNTLIISSMNSLTMPSADITGDSNFGTILESKVCVSAANTSINQ